MCAHLLMGTIREDSLGLSWLPCNQSQTLSLRFHRPLKVFFFRKGESFPSSFTSLPKLLFPKWRERERGFNFPSSARLFLFKLNFDLERLVFQLQHSNIYEYH